MAARRPRGNVRIVRDAALIQVICAFSPFPQLYSKQQRHLYRGVNNPNDLSRLLTSAPTVECDGIQGEWQRPQQLECTLQTAPPVHFPMLQSFSFFLLFSLSVSRAMSGSSYWDNGVMLLYHLTHHNIL